jgi:uncharacterized protein YjiS (DUF1127 family)
MTSIVENPKSVSQFLLPVTGSLTGWIADRVAAIGRVIAGRRVLRELAAFDERMLRDIGITRSDLRSAVSEPLYRDPTSLLAGRVAETRSRRGRQVNVISY